MAAERHIDIVPPVAPPPHNTEIEAALLGAILTSNHAYQQVGDILRPEHFYEPVLGRIYAAAAEIVDAGGQANPLTLYRRFEHDPDLTEAGGARYLYDLAGSVVTLLAARDYALEIVDLWRKRRIGEVCARVIETTRDGTVSLSASDLLTLLDGDLSGIGDDPARSGPVSMGHAAREGLDRAEAAMKARAEGRSYGVPTGLRELDNLLGGLFAGELIILAGRPSAGKTALATTIARNAARSMAEDGEPYSVLIHSLEMSAASLGVRELAAATGISADRMNRGALSDTDLTGPLWDAAEAARDLPIWVEDRPDLSLSSIRSSAIRMSRRKQGLDLLIVDHLGLMDVGSDGRMQMPTLIGRVTKGLRNLAKQLGIPVVLLSQLNRGVEQRDDKRPMLADLRESGTIEQDADVVLFVYREEYYLARQEPQMKLGEDAMKYGQRQFDWQRAMDRAAGKGEIIVAKVRQGRIGSVKCAYDGRRLTWTDLYEPLGDDQQERLPI